MNSSGVDKLVTDNIEQYGQFKNSLINGLYADETLNAVYMSSSSGKKLLTVEKNNVTIRPLPPQLYSYGALLVSSGKLYMSDGRKVAALPVNEYGDWGIVYKDTIQAFLGTLNEDPYR